MSANEELSFLAIQYSSTYGSWVAKPSNHHGFIKVGMAFKEEEGSFYLFLRDPCFRIREAHSFFSAVMGVMTFHISFYCHPSEDFLS